MTYLSYFGGKQKFQEDLVNFAREKRMALGISQKEIDRRAGLDIDLPSCKEYEEDPSKMNSGIFSAIGFPLKINVTDSYLFGLVKQKITKENFLEIIVGAIEELDAA